MNDLKLVVVFSGGMDSTTLLFDLMRRNFTISSLVSVNYGQRHKRELDFARSTAEKLNIPFHLIDLSNSHFTEAISVSRSSLVSDTEVPDGHYAEENMKATVVPNRNMVLLSIAGSIAVAENADGVATAVHAGDHFIYPDCRPQFLGAASEALRLGNEGFGYVQGILAPFASLTKAEIARIGIHVGLDFSTTWSCYKGGEFHCGTCGTCVERLEALDAAAIAEGKTREEIDSTHYLDTDFWRTAVENAKEGK